jgi:hypothetical protein
MHSARKQISVLSSEEIVYGSKANRMPFTPAFTYEKFAVGNERKWGKIAPALVIFPNTFLPPDHTSYPHPSPSAVLIMSQVRNRHKFFSSFKKIS